MEREEQINKKIDKAYISSLAFNTDECEICLSDEVKKEYELKFENGKFLFVKKRKYPKTYNVCLEILGYNTSHTIPMNHGHKGLLFMRFQRLIICRDAYWKIAGDWKPDWKYASQDKFVIYNDEYNICLNSFALGNNVLAFPTEEMRDAFYENFKDLIEECKELL